MKELRRTSRITIAVILFIAVLAFGWLTMKKPSHIYQITPEEMADEITMIYQVTPEEAMEYMWDSMYVFVDLRPDYQFSKGHIENAVNMPIPSLLSDENKKRFEAWKKDSIQVVFYGEDELQANTPWLLFYELGYDNIRALMGGINYLDAMYDGSLGEDESFSVEDPAYDFAGIVEKAAAARAEMPVENVVPEKKEVVVRKKKKKEAEGGC
jgi:predicted sulfurtransferase